MIAPWYLIMMVFASSYSGWKMLSIPMTDKEACAVGAAQFLKQTRDEAENKAFCIASGSAP
ncbi:hypothetical protein [Gluconobacter morbifer]|uniref:Uncharacterized protein n=1 Tax=Gluconobacter morbifer G707 TaxID=1088869 RepID=G6XIW9_9PROT|nr:hypothetical protein [Gluconobacter morbifer]EHH68399.1 hypothetical protein GMO_11690 [Gluconobacter morbifer G707]